MGQIFFFFRPGTEGSKHHRMVFDEHGRLQGRGLGRRRGRPGLLGAKKDVRRNHGIIDVAKIEQKTKRHQLSIPHLC